MTSPEAVLAAPSAVGGLAAASWRDYLALLKPRVMSLVIFTAVTGLICAGRPMDPALAFVAILCIAVGAGGSAALNMAFDADIDALMQRTRRRPVPAGRIQAGDAKTLGFLLSVFSVGLMGLAVNLLAAGLLAFTIAFYVGVYTLWLKRRTPQNIVIGGLAGALPPAVGWAAASGTTPLNAWLLVAIIFIWTPPHFWALALYTKADYARAGVPMMPVVRGEASTRRQILAYCLLLAPLGAAPAFTGLGGWLYLAVAVLGGAALVGLATRLMALGSGGVGEDRAPMAGKQTLYAVLKDAKPARDLFAVSLAYLFALFAALLAEKLIGLPPLVPHP
jgi:protoheme IX farnesyltransferase